LISITRACTSGGDIGDRLFVDSGRDTEIKIAGRQKGELVIIEPTVEQVTETIRANKIDVMISDPFVSCHSVSENDNAKIDAVVKNWARIADETRLIRSRLRQV
jgi:hypothetical protein